MNAALVLAGGKGRRVGEKIPKQFIEINKKPVMAYCIDTLSAHPGIDSIWIAADAAWHDYILHHISTDKFCGFSNPGENRQLSIMYGLEAVREYVDDSDYMFIHDAARPMLSAKLISECLEAAMGHDGVLPVLPMKDTVYYSADGNKVSALLNRNEIYAGQAPEIFRFGAYYEANRRLLPDKILAVSGSTEPAVLAGMDIVMIHGDENNFKITTRTDLERFQKMLGEKEY